MVSLENINGVLAPGNISYIWAHNVCNGLQLVYTYHTLNENLGKFDEETAEIIDSISTVVRDVFERIIKNNLVIPDAYSREKIEAFFIKSDFDWKDSLKYNSLMDWFNEGFSNSDGHFY